MLVALIYLYHPVGSFDIKVWHHLPIGSQAQTLLFFAFLPPSP